MSLHTQDFEKVINMQRFSSILSNVQCGNSSIVLTFRTNDTFKEAVSEWDWVNVDPEHKLIFVADWPSCLNGTQLQPYYIDHTAMNPQADTITLYGTPQSWHDTLKAFELEWGTMYTSQPPTAANASDLTKRFDLGTWNPSFNVPLTSNFDGNIVDASGQMGKNTFTVKADCTHCGTTGTMKFQGKLTVTIDLGVSECSMTVTPADITAFTNIAVNAMGYGAVTLQYSKTLAQWPIAGVEILNDVLELGLVAKLKAGVGIKNFNGSVDMDFGITGKIPNTAKLKFDLVNEANSDYSSWDPTWTHTFAAKSSFAFDADIFLQVGIGLQAGIFKKGYEAVVSAKIPDLVFHIVPLHDTAGVCGDKNKSYGVDWTLKGCLSAGWTVKQQGDLSVTIDPTPKKKRDGYYIDAPAQDYPRHLRRAARALDRAFEIDEDDRAAALEAYHEMQKRGDPGITEADSEITSEVTKSALALGVGHTFAQKCWPLTNAAQCVAINKRYLNWNEWSGPGRAVPRI
jgi:hypothetical protein